MDVKLKANVNLNNKKLWWGLDPNDICLEFKTNIQSGLTTSEVENRLEKYGLNQLPEQKKISPLKIFIRQFSSFIIWVLIGALIIALVIGEVVDASVIGGIVILNALLGFIQEYRAEKSLIALRKLSSPNSRVIRDGILQVVPSNKVVPGDVVLLEAGDSVPADGRVVQSIQLAAQEAVLTGESMPVKKIIKTLEKKELQLRS